MQVILNRNTEKKINILILYCTIRGIHWYQNIYKFELRWKRFFIHSYGYQKKNFKPIHSLYCIKYIQYVMNNEHLNEIYM